ncbi:MAG TPA: hypothetical protein VM865_00610 [Acidobacteriaceae bacterium]|nr:hypothetical protein [Acidobacteriaceae bacterium]
MPKPNPITYFDSEGNENLSEVLKVIKRTVQKRPELQGCKVIFLTAEGHGPALAYNMLEQFGQKIIAVTFSPFFCLQRQGKQFHPQISSRVRKFFQGVEIPILTSRLPFESFGGSQSSISSTLKLVNDAFAVFGGSVPLAIQAVLQACDMGHVQVGEVAIVATGDCALLVSASSSAMFLSVERGLCVLEILCKPRRFDISRPKPPQPQTIEASPDVGASENKAKLELP